MLKMGSKSNNYCSVPLCKRYRTATISLHKFPTDEKMRQKWAKSVKLNKPITKTSMVCSLHFARKDYFPDLEWKSRRRLKRGAVPSYNVPGKLDKRLPADDKTRQLWLNSVPPDSLRTSTKNHYVCSEHFAPDSFQPPFLGLNKRMLKKGAYPTIFDSTTDDTIEESSDPMIYVNNDDSTSNCAIETDPLAIETTNDERLLFGLRHDVGCQTDLTNRRHIHVQTRPPRATDSESELKREIQMLKKRLKWRDLRIEHMKTLLEQQTNFTQAQLTSINNDLSKYDEEEFNIIVIE